MDIEIKSMPRDIIILFADAVMVILTLTLISML